MRHPTEPVFLKDTKDHAMTVVADDKAGNRHLLFKAPGSGCHHFRIVTFADYLCYVGDMGGFVFRRTTDMFRFFRNSKDDGPLNINPSYWCEKVEAAGHDGAMAFCPDKARQAIASRLDDVETSFALRQRVEESVLSTLCDGEWPFFNAVHEFEFEGFRFNDFEYSCRDYTYRFVWACYAIVWAIRQYDMQRSAVAA